MHIVKIWNEIFDSFEIKDWNTLGFSSSTILFVIFIDDLDKISNINTFLYADNKTLCLRNKLKIKIVRRNLSWREHNCSVKIILMLIRVIWKIKHYSFQKLLLRNMFNYCLINSYVVSISNHTKLLALLFYGEGGGGTNWKERTVIYVLC